MNKKTNFRKIELKTEIIAALIALLTTGISAGLFMLVFKFAYPKTQLATAVFSGYLLANSYRKTRKEKTYQTNLEHYNEKLKQYEDFKGFKETEFNMLNSGYHIVYHENVKAKVRYYDNKWHIRWEDTVRELFKDETLNLLQNGLRDIDRTNELFKKRFRELHFSFDWDELNWN
jgi:hypothetical protein